MEQMISSLQVHAAPERRWVRNAGLTLAWLAYVALLAAIAVSLFNP